VSDLAHRPPTLPAQREDADRTVGTLVYAAYLASPLTLGVSALVGALVAAGRRDQAGPVAASHFRFQVWTFWLAAGAVAAGALWFTLGGVHALAANRGDGGWLAIAGAALCGAAAVGYLGASLYGLSRLMARSPVGRLLGR
jgi:uncharacterized membrane protein